MDYAKLLKKTIEQEEKFLFPEFKREWIPELADCIFKYAEKYKDESNVGLEIWINDFCVYRYYQPGLGPIFANYVRRKRGTVTMWGTSSMRKKAEFGVAKETLAALKSMVNAGPTEASVAARAKVTELREAFMEAMRDDFNTALAISHMFALAKEINIYKAAVEEAGIKPDGKLVAMFDEVFAEMCSIIGVLENTAVKEEAADSKESELVELLISMRQEARKAKNYALADELRNKLAAIGITLQDTPQGVKWSK